LTDIVGYALSLPPLIKQELLGEPNVVARYEILLKHLSPLDTTDTASLQQPEFHENSRRSGEFPPRFSDN
jgi:hypothetical protein